MEWIGLIALIYL
uniref:Uncharacterized protein n=1 Tax=Rhizophora mucronata TaxID=61149 RepID=A0A2P2NZG5_RHIMU